MQEKPHGRPLLQMTVHAGQGGYIMTAILIVTTVGILLFGYYIAGRLDRVHKVQKHSGQPVSLKRRANRGILICGSKDLVLQLEKADVRCTETDGESALFPEDVCYSALFALSGDDRKNIRLCRMARNADSDIYILARCAQSGNRYFYEEAGADRILMPDESPQEALSGLFSQSAENIQKAKVNEYQNNNGPEHIKIASGYNGGNFTVKYAANVRH